MHISDLKTFTSVRNQRAKQKLSRSLIWLTSSIHQPMQPGVHTAENSHQRPWAPSQCKDDGWMEFLITNIRWLRDHLIFIMGIPMLVKRYLYTEMVPLDPGLRPLCNNLDDPKPEIKIYKYGSLHTHTWLQGHIMDKTIKKHSKATKSWSNGHYGSILSCTDTLWN